MLVRLLSDVHYERFRNTPSAVLHACTILPRAGEQVLILAGDICTIPDHYPIHDGDRFHQVMSAFKASWKHVLFVPGNHEYTHTGRAPSTDKEEISKNYSMLHACDRLGVKTLLRRRHTVDGWRFAGCTLWTPTTAPQIHKHDRKYLSLSNSDTDVFITHHLPSFQCIAPQYKNRPVVDRSATDLEPLMRPPLRYWLHGHTHTPVDLTINGVRVLASPIGNPPCVRMGCVVKLSRDTAASVP